MNQIKDADGNRCSVDPMQTKTVGPLPKLMLLNEIGDEGLLILAADPNYWMQEKYDGNRIMLVKRDGALTSYSRTGRETSALPKPIVTAAMACAADFILDGEIVGDDVWAFDLISWTGVSIREQPYTVRYQRLLDAFTNSASGIHVVAAATTPDEKLAMFARVLGDGGEGVVLKRASAAYQSGRPSSGGDALKYKFVSTATVVVASHNVQASFNMKLFNGTDVGRCTIPPNKTAPPVGSCADIRFLNFARGGSLYQPVFLGVREDITPEECTIDQFRFKGESKDS